MNNLQVSVYFEGPVMEEFTAERWSIERGFVIIHIAKDDRHKEHTVAFPVCDVVKVMAVVEGGAS